MGRRMKKKNPAGARFHIILPTYPAIIFIYNFPVLSVFLQKRKGHELS
jgi:hypothetical protein